MDEEKFLTVGEAAAMLHVSKSKVRRLIKAGVLKKHQYLLDARYHMVEREQVEDLIKKHRIRSVDLGAP